MPRKSTRHIDYKTISDRNSDAIMPRLVRIKQTAAYCSCSVWAIRQLIWSKELRACKIGNR